MTSFFEAAFASTDPIQDSVYGEAFRIEPQASGADVNARRSADPSRPAQTITGIWTDPHVQIFPRNRTGHRDTEASRIGDEKPKVDFVTAALPYRLVIGDLVTRISDGSRHAVSDPGDGELSRTAVTLTSARAP